MNNQKTTTASPYAFYLLLLAVIISGFVALSYEIIWTRLLGLFLGNDMLGIIGVLTGFFGGMVIGALYTNRFVKKSTDPIGIFMVLELFIALYALGSPFLIDMVNEWFLPILGEMASERSVLVLLLNLMISCLLLLPATFCMGASFAFAVEGGRRVSYSTPHRVMALIYSFNIVGSVLGVAVAVYFLLPQFGFDRSTHVLSLLAGFGLLMAAIARKGYSLLPGSAREESISEKELKTAFPDIKYQYYLLFLTGFAGMGIELGITHGLKHFLENTVFTFSNILVCFLLGTAIGSWLHQRMFKSVLYEQKLTRNLSLLLAIACFGAFGLLFKTQSILELFVAPESPAYWPNIRAEFFASFILLFIPTVFMGLLFAQLMNGVPQEKTGQAYGVNLLGATIAPLLSGLLLLPLIGGMAILLLSIGLYLVVYGLLSYQVSLKKPIWIVGLAFVALVLVCPKSPPNFIGENEKVLYEKEGWYGEVVVSNDPTNSTPQFAYNILQVCNKFRMGGQRGFSSRRFGNLPLLLHPNPKKGLYLGVGTGSTLSQGLNYPLEKITGIELVPEVKEVLPHFTQVNNTFYKDERVSIKIADARKFVKTTHNQYDFIIGDLFHPARDGTAYLYTKEHFAQVKSKLNEGGMYTQWLPLHQLGVQEIQSIIRTFLDVFPETHGFIGTYSANTSALMLVGFNAEHALSVDLNQVNTKITRNRDIQAYIENYRDWLGSYWMGPEGLMKYAGKAPLNTDLNPVVLFTAPRRAYFSISVNTSDNIRSMLPYRSFPAPDFFEQSSAGQNEVDYDHAKETWEAVGVYLRALLVYDKNEVQAVKGLIKAYETDPDFSPARGGLFSMANKNDRYAKVIMERLIPRDQLRLKRILQNPMSYGY